MNEEEKNLQPEKAGLDEKRKNALLRYIAVLFAVAFVLVLLSMFSQMRSSKTTISELNQSSTSALENIQKLQEQNQLLTEENQLLEQELSDTKTEAERTEQAYEDLLLVLKGQAKEGDVSASRALENLKNLKKYLGTNGQEAYQNLLTEGEENHD